MAKAYIQKKRNNKAAKQFGYNNPKPVQQTSSSRITPDLAEKIKRDASNDTFNYNVINGFRLIDVEYKMPSKVKREGMRNQFKKEARSNFIKFLAENKAEELKAMGISQEGVERMRKGFNVNGYNIHHKLPIAGGGTNDFSNLIIIPIPPHDDLHHLIIDPQIKDKSPSAGVQIKLPWSDDMVWKRPEKALDNVAQINPPLYLQAEKSEQNAEATAATIAKVLQKQGSR